MIRTNARFFYKQYFYKYYQAEISKKISKAKQHHEAELLTGRKQNMPKKKNKKQKQKAKTKTKK